MMRKVFFGSFLMVMLITGLSLFSKSKASVLDTTEKYRVINVQGRIVFKKLGTEMKRGDIYVPGVVLDFLTDNARAAIINKDKGRFVLSGNSKGKVKVLPAANNISSRSGALLNVVDVKQYFENRLLILDKTEIQIGSQAFPMNKENFFYLTYDHNGEEIAKKLSYNEDRLVLDKSEIFMVDGQPIPVEEKEMNLYYRQDGKGKKISTFTPVFPDLVDLKAEVSVILEIIEDEAVDSKINEITAHLNEFYGKPNKENLANWLKTEFELEGTK